jgi:hypothetical protein
MAYTKRSDHVVHGYVDNLRIYTRCFDPFRRSDRIELSFMGGVVETTVSR